MLFAQRTLRRRDSQHINKAGGQRLRKSSLHSITNVANLLIVKVVGNGLTSCDLFIK